MQLSAGQRQLLALTRALVWDPAVLLLDEATAAVDSASEAAIRAAMRAAVIGSGRAVLTVAHRLATAQEADRVLVMELVRSWKWARQRSSYAEEDGLLHCWSWKPLAGTGRRMGEPSGRKRDQGYNPPRPRSRSTRLWDDRSSARSAAGSPDAIEGSHVNAPRPTTVWLD